MPAMGGRVGLEDSGASLTVWEKNCQENLYFGLNQRLVTPEAEVPKVPIY